MAIIAWIVLGLVVGLFASALMQRGGRGLLLEMALGVVGAFGGGYLFTHVGSTGVTGVTIYSLLVSLIAAVLVLFVYHALVITRAL